MNKILTVAAIGLLTVTAVGAQNSKAELDALLSNMAAGKSTPISPQELAAKLNTSREIVKDIGTTGEVKAFDAQLTEANRLAAEGKAKEAETKRISSEAAENRRVAAIREANAREEQRSMDWERKEEQERLRRQNSKDPNPLPSMKKHAPCKSTRPGECTIDR